VEIGSGTRALVTGASRGIGRALVEALAARGATVGLAARSTTELEALADVLAGEHHVLECDVAARASVEAAVDGFAKAAGGLDLVVANAGITHYRPVLEQPVEHIEQMTQVNWLGTVYTVKAALPHLIEGAGGHVVVISSGAGLRSFPSAAAYGATKAAQRMFAAALRHELDATGVSVTTVYPGEIATSLHEHEKATMPAWYRGDRAAAPAEALAARILKAVETDRRELHYPVLVKLLGIVNGLSPRAADAMLRRLRGASAAPRRG
jgi:short-subunit dehydrogenase